MFDRVVAITLVGILCGLGVQTHGNSSEKPLKVRAIYPEGEAVSPYHRITIEFNQNIVALGTSMFIEDEVPIDIEPALDCEWNWVSLDTLKCELPGDTDLNGSTEYTVTVRPGIKAPNGQALEAEYVHSFQTVLPSIVDTELVSWVSPTQPVIEVTFNQKVSLSSIRDRLRFKDSISGEEIPSFVRAYSWGLMDALRGDYFGRANRFQSRIFGGGNSQFDKFLRNSVLVSPQDKLSPGLDVALSLLAGVSGANGNLKSIEDHQLNTEITTFDEFRMLGLSCKDISGADIFLKVDEPNDNACSVLSDIELVFSSRFADPDISNFVHTEPPTNTPDWSGIWGGGRETEIGGFVYSLIGDFKSSTKYRLYVSQKKKSDGGLGTLTPVRDGFGRTLKGKYEMTFRTGPPAPKAYLNGTNVVVDSRETVDPQIVLGNIDDVAVSYDVLDEMGTLQNQYQQKQSPTQDDVFQAQFLGLRDVLRSPSGVLIGNVDGQPRFDHPKKEEREYFYVHSTPYSAFLKLGTVTTIAWVIDFQSGEPIADASVEFIVGDPNDLSTVSESIHSGVTDQNGLVSLPGYESFDPHWNRVVHEINRACPDEEECAMYFVRVETDEGLALLPLDSDFILQGAASISSIYRNLDHWITTSQKLYSPGDTVHIKGYVRSVRNEVRVIPATGHYALCVEGPNAREYEIAPISLNQFGAYDVSLKLNDRTEFGTYDIELIYHPSQTITEPCTTSSDNPGTYTAIGGSFDVFEFKTNPIYVSQQLNATQYERGDDMSITTRVELHAGGPYAHAKGQLDIRLTSNWLRFESVDHEQYVFGMRDEKVSPFGREFGANIELNDQGNHTHTINSLNNDLYYGEYWITSSVISDRGKSVAERVSVPYFGVDQFVGVNRNHDDIDHWTYSNDWASVNEPWPIQVVVVSKEDEMVTGKEVQIKVFESQLHPDLLEHTSLYSSDIRWKKIFDCTLVSDHNPVSCDFTPEKKNFYLVEAQIIDTKGNTHRSTFRFEARDEKRSPIPIVQATEEVELEFSCDSDKVAVGDNVHCTVENQLSSSPALVTIERSGVIDSWLVRLDPGNPVIEFTVREDYAPHFELAVLSVSPTNSTNHSGDSRYRLGNQKFTMNNPLAESIPIKLATNKESYGPRERVELSISADDQEGGVVPIEYAIAVIDEALLDLGSATDEYFDPTRKRWALRTRGLRTYGLIAAFMEESDLLSLTPEPYWDHRPVDPYYGEAMASASYRLMDEFGRSASPLTNIRTLDRFVAYWNPSVTSQTGQETITFDLPDNLTSWKVVVLAVSTADRFGYATTTFGSIKDTEIRAVAPNVVTEGDKFHIGASILNRADRVRTLTIELQASGLLDEESTTEIRQEVEFQPIERKVVSWEIQAGTRPTNFQDVSRNSEIRVVASASDSRDADALDIRIPVRPRHVRVSSVAYGALGEDTTNIPIEVPAKLATEDGQLDLTLTTNEEVNFDGVFRYAIGYPYPCWEQKLTQAILAMQYLDLEERGVKHGIEWPDAKATIVRVLDTAVDFQVQNGGMVYFRAQDSSPYSRYSSDADAYLSAYTSIAFSWLDNAGYDVPKKVHRKLIDYLREYLDEQKEEQDIFDIDATINAVILNALALSGELKESDLAHFSAYINQMKLFGLAHYLQASISQNSNSSLNRQIFDRIMNHRSLVDGTVEFIESNTLTYTRMLHSDTRSLCTVLSALTKFSDTNTNGIDVGELKELSNSVRYARDNSPHWVNTQENVFCTHALIEFADFVDLDTQDWIATIELQSSDTGRSIRLANAWQFNANNTKHQTLHPMNAQNFGSSGALEINRTGSGHAFYSVELAYLTTIDERINRFSGFEVHREYFTLRENGRWSLLRPGDYINKGDHVFVNLFVNNRFTRYHVVVDDTVPGGLEPVNQSLGTEYSPIYREDELEDILSQSKWYRKFRENDSRWPLRLQKFHSELGLQNVRFYSDVLMRGKHHLTWAGQAIAAGEFTVLPTHVEEMYRPIMFGKSEPWTLRVKTE